MSHIPASAMPHAQAHDDASEAAPEENATTTTTERVEQAAAGARDAATDAAHKAGTAAKQVADRANALPTYVKLIGAAAIVGAAAAAIIVPAMGKAEPADKPKRGGKARKGAAKKD